MKVDALQQLVINALNDLKGLDIVTLDVRDMTTIADVMIICCGRSNVHVRSLAENVVKKAKEHHLSFIKTEGQKEGEWVIVDLADVVVHIMLPVTRAFYKLEDFWAPIKEMREQYAHSSTRNR